MARGTIFLSLWRGDSWYSLSIKWQRPEESPRLPSPRPWPSSPESINRILREESLQCSLNPVFQTMFTEFLKSYSFVVEVKEPSRWTFPANPPCHPKINQSSSALNYFITGVLFENSSALRQCMKFIESRTNLSFYK